MDQCKNCNGVFQQGPTDLNDEELCTHCEIELNMICEDIGEEP